MTDDAPTAGEPSTATIVGYLIPDRIRIPLEYDVRARPEATDRAVEIELTGLFGVVGVELTARQASDLASQLSLAAHHDEETDSEGAPE